MKRSILFLCTCLLFLSSAIAAPINSEDATKYFAHIVELVIKQDIPNLHKEFTPEVQQKISQQFLKDFLQKILAGVGEPRGMDVTGFNIYPNNQEYCQVQGIVKFSNEKVIVTAVLKQTDKGFALHHLNLNLPQGSRKIETLAGRPKKFLKNVFFETLQKQGVESAMNYVDSNVRKEVGDDLIKTIVSRLKEVTIQGVKNYNVQNTVKGTMHRFVLVGLLHNEPCDVEIILRPEKDSYRIMDINIYQQ